MAHGCVLVGVIVQRVSSGEYLCPLLPDPWHRWKEEKASEGAGAGVDGDVDGGGHREGGSPGGNYNEWRLHEGARRS